MTSPSSSAADVTSPSRVLPGRARRRIMIAVGGWVLVAGVIALLWPAQFGGFLSITALRGDDMLPGYAPSDVVLTVREPSYAAGDVILIDASNAAGDQLTPGVVTGAEYAHDRIVYATSAGVNAAPAAVNADAVLGRVILHLPTVGIAFSPAVLPYVVGMAAAALAIVLTLRFRRIEPPEALAAEQQPRPSEFPEGE